MRAALRVVLSALALTALPASVFAQDLSPRQIYDRGAAEYDAHDYAKAAADFARADELSPNEVTLTYALEAAIRGHTAALGMNLVSRVEERAAPGTHLLARAEEARTSFRGEVGQVVVSCPPPATFCKATVDKQHVTIAAATFVLAGTHVVHIDADGVESDQSVQVDAQRTTNVAPPAAPPPAPAAPVPAPTTPPPAVAAPPPPPPTPAPRHAERLGTTWFWLAGMTTVVLGAASIVSGVDTDNRYDDYTKTRTPNARSVGESAQLRTNILFCATAIAGIGTGVLGLFFVGWSRGAATVTASAKF